MSGNYETPKKEIIGLIDNYAKTLKPTREFLGDYFINVGDYCRTHFKRKEISSLREVQKCFAQARKGADSNEANREFLQGAMEICKKCERNYSEIPALFKLVDKIFKLNSLC